MESVDLGQVFTRRNVADYMVSCFTLPPKSVIADPCFGCGVFLDSLIANKPEYSVCGYEIDSNLYRSYKEKNPEVTLHNTDFLLSNNYTKYDGIIMNPPYIRHEKIDDLILYGISKAKLAENAIYKNLPKSANLYMYFIVRAIEQLKPNGELIVIFPDSWLNSKNGAAFKNIISEQCSVIKKIHINGDAFEQAALVDVIILKLKKNAKFADCKPTHIHIDQGCLRETKTKHIEHTTDNRIPFLQYATIRRGITTGYNKLFINPALPDSTDNIYDILSSPKSVKGYSTSGSKTDKILVISKDDRITPVVKRYLEKWRNHISTNNSPKTLSLMIKKKKPWYIINHVDCKGIVFGYIIRNDMRFILNEKGTMVRDNFYIIYPNIDIYLMFALLNNYYTYMHLETIGRKYGGGVLKLQKYDIESLFLTSILNISVEDKENLCALGKMLATSGNKKIIDDISSIISKYEVQDMQTVKEQLEYIRNRRVGGAI